MQTMLSVSVTSLCMGGNGNVVHNIIKKHLIISAMYEVLL